MTGSRIYSDFAADAGWVRDRISSDVAELPRSHMAAAEYYVTDRLRILSKSTSQNRIAPKLGRPVPYAAYWFADAFGSHDLALRRATGLCLVYNSLATTLKDDTLDTTSPNKSSIAFLANYWSSKYFMLAKSVFPSVSSFWKADRFAKSEWGRYDRWNESFDETARFNSYSERFLRESSRYFVAVVFPALAGLAFASAHASRIPAILRFLRRFSMGWRIFDDLMDWEKDLSAPRHNRSSVLYQLARVKRPAAALTRDFVLGSYLDVNFVSKTYRAMLGFLREARDVAEGFHSFYLSTFMKEQLEFHTRRRDELLRSDRAFFRRLKLVLEDKATRPSQ